MNTGKPYHPINCDLHDLYEIAIMHGDTLKIMVEGERLPWQIQPTNVYVKEGAEYLQCNYQGKEHILRLDRIRIITDPKRRSSTERC